MLWKKVLTPHFLFIGIVTVTFLTHLLYIPNGFTWLDHGDIERGRTLLPVERLPNAFLARFGDTGFYRPVVTILNSLDAAFYGHYAPGFHLTNIFLHVAVTALIPYVLTVYFSVTKKQALLAALFFGIHPLSFLPVGAISYRAELLMTLFVLSTMFLHSKARVTESIRYTLLCAASLFLAVCSKETSLFLIPTSILVWEIWSRKRITPKKKHRMPLFSHYWPLLIIECFTILFYLTLRLLAVPEFWRAEAIQLPFAQAVSIRLFTVGKLLILLVNPLTPPLSDVLPFVSPITMYAVLTICVTIAVILFVYKHGPSSIFSKPLLLLLFFLAPALNIIPVPRLGSPHYAYIALLPFCLLVILFFSHVYNRIPRSKPAFAILAIIWGLIACTQTFFGGTRFQNDKTLFAPEVKREPRFLEGYFYLGNYYLETKDYKRAETMYMQALQPQRNFHAYVEPVSVMTNLAAVYYAKGQYEKADQILEKLQSQLPENQQYTITYNRALIAYEQKQYEKVIILLKNNHGDNPLALLLLADALHAVKHNQEAIQILQKTLPYLSKDKQERVYSLIERIASESASFP